MTRLEADAQDMRSIYGDTGDPEALEEIKVKIPRRQRVLLHSLKVLGRSSLRDAVVEALDEYFERRGVKP